MPNNVFYAWQSDTTLDLNKNFIWDALLQATGRLATGIEPEEAVRLERDTQGTSGNPNIAQTIFDKIRDCSVFIADLTFVASTEGGKKASNPNVSIELGYAARSIGWNRIILVLNEAQGEADDLPFDLRQHRWPISYRLTQESTTRDQKLETLSIDLENAINLCEEHSNTRVVEMAEALDPSVFAFVAIEEQSVLIPLPLPPQTKGELLEQLDNSIAIRRLIELGALHVTDQPEVGYAWTYDGLRMIEQIHESYPGLLRLMLEHWEARLGKRP